MTTTTFWTLLFTTLMCTAFIACGDDEDEEANFLSAYYYAPTRDDLVNHGPWTLETRKDVFDDEGFPLGTKYEVHELSFNYDGTGWERRYGYLSTYGKNEDEFDTGQQEFTFRYKTTTEGSENIEDVYGTLAINDSRTIIVTLPVDNNWGYKYRLSFDGIAYEGKDFPQTNPTEPDIPDTPNNPDNEPTTLNTIDGYEFADLGLSVKWAASNLSGYYQYGNPSANDFKSEYELSSGTSKDPATANMSSKWRLPTRTEMQELAEQCTWYYTGYSFEVTGPNGNSIQLPLAGAYPLGGQSSLLYSGYQCWLMTSTLDNSGNPRPYILKATYTNSSTRPTVTVTTNEAYRFSGMSVRGVSQAARDLSN